MITVSYSSWFILQYYIYNVDYKAAVKELPFVPEHRALKLKATVDCEVNGVKRKAGEMWHIEGPTTYVPSPDLVC